MDHVEVLERLLAKGHTQASLERALRLSPNYLSKVRHRAVKPSFQLAALLAVLERHPKAFATLDATPMPSLAAAPPPTRREVREPLVELLSLVATLDAAGVRYALIGTGAYFDGDAQLDVIVHDNDRQVLGLFRNAGLLVGHYTSSLFRVRRVDARADEAFTIHFATLPPLIRALGAAQRRVVRGVDASVVPPLEMAAFFLLNRDEEAEGRARQLVDARLVDTTAVRALLADFDKLSPTKSPYVLQFFDRDLAAQRLTQIETPS